MPQHCPTASRIYHDHRRSIRPIDDGGMVSGYTVVFERAPYCATERIGPKRTDVTALQTKSGTRAQRRCGLASTEQVTRLDSAFPCRDDVEEIFFDDENFIDRIRAYPDNI
jgi:hypothetical protein